jgi:hypothetical protein
MRRLTKFLCLSRRKRCLILQSTVLLFLVRTGLGLLPLVVITGLLKRVLDRTAAHQSEAEPMSAPDVVDALVKASRCVPFSTCLTRSVVAQALLRRHGHAPRLYIGVRKDTDGTLKAHAWLENQGTVVLGGSEPGHFKALLMLES